VNKTFAPDRKMLLSHPAHFLSLGFGAGLLPGAPGTFGTIVAIPVYLLMVLNLSTVHYAVVTLVLAGIGMVVCEYTERAIGAHDHGSIVWDEIVGFIITMFLAPVTWWSIVAGFLFFRFFDILKPFPVSWLDTHLRGGIGTMMDDVAAGLLAFASLQLLVYVLSPGLPPG
jgi:phosphatidylglycerophosphatase A